MVASAVIIAICSTVGGCVLTTGVGCLAPEVRRRCGYLFLSNHKVSELEDKLKKLENVPTEAHALLQKLNNPANKTCFYGWLPNPMARYRHGKEASEMVELITKLIERGQLSEVAFENRPRGLVTEASAPNLIFSGGRHDGTIIESRVSILEDIMNALDDGKLKVIGIYGPGGVGKTTLLGEVEKRLRNEKKLFRLIALTTVSQNLDLKKIQDDIAYALGLNLKDEPSEVGRRDLLFQKLQSDSTKVLIILDDLWKKLDLEVVGIPSGEKSGKCKLLLTSRYKEVLTEMQCAPSTSIFHLQGLKDDEAFRLFKKTVGDRLEDDEDVRAIAPEVVKKLAGLPLLINSVATTLKDSNLSAWKNALIKIEESKIEAIVKLSYDRLSEDAKTLFRVCGLMGGTIRVELLLGLGMGLGLFEEFNCTIENARHKLDTMVTRLRSVCLLEDGGDDEEIVTIHDLYSEIVVSTQLGAQDSLVMNSNYGSWTKEKLEKCWAIRLTDVGRDRLAETMTCQFRELEILMLSEHGEEKWRMGHRAYSRDCCGPLNFKDMKMKELRVLYLHCMHIAPLPSLKETLNNLRSLYLDNCDVEDVAILGELEELRVLSFAGSTISTLPKEIGKLTKLRSLNVSRCYWLRIIERGALKSLINLEELLMKKSLDQLNKGLESWKAMLAELKSLTKLTALDMCFPYPAQLLEDGDLPFGKLNRFCIDVGGGLAWELASNKFLRYERIMNLNLQECNSILSKEWVKNTLQTTQILFLRSLTKSEESVHELCIRGFSQLKHLNILDSPSIKYIAGSSNDHPPLSAFTSLESLQLKYLDNLEKICHGPVDLKCFGKLKDMTVLDCVRLKSLCSHSDMQGLVHLEEIQVSRCDLMQAIITYDTKIVEAAPVGIVELPKVRKLKLDKLRSMTSFCAPAQLNLPCLEELELHEVGFPQKIWYSSGLSESSFCKLASFSLYKCPDIVNVFPSTTIGGLPNLEKFTIYGCSSLESLVDCGSLDSNTEQVMSFPSLRCLWILECPNVGAFVRSPTSAERPLDEIIEENDKLTQSFFNKMVTFPNIRELRIEGIRCEELWNNQIPDDAFCKLESLRLERCDELRHIASSYMWKRLQRSLEILRVISCPLIEVIYEGDGTDRECGKLRSLVMCDLDSLKHIWRSDGQPNVPFPNLRKVGAMRCSRLEILFASFTEKFLGQIEELVVESCEDMKLIAGREEGEGPISREIIFSKLTALGLLELPQFKSFLPEKYSPNFPSLNFLNRESCGNKPDENLGKWLSYKRTRTFPHCDHEEDFQLWDWHDKDFRLLG